MSPVANLACSAAPSAAPSAPLAFEAAWAHPLVAAGALAADRPLAVRLLGSDWVLWRDAAGHPVAAPDRCPHRGAQLSAGAVLLGELQCPYHGWRFAGDGRCTQVPATPGWVPPAGHGLAARPLVEAHGLLWLPGQAGGAGAPAAGASEAAVAGPAGLSGAAGPGREAGPAPSAEPPPFEGEGDARLRGLLVGPFDVATSAPRVVENFLDMAHFAFVHAGWLGEPGRAEVPPYTVTLDGAGLHARGCRAWQPRSNLRSAGGRWVDYRYDVPTPWCAQLTKLPEDQAGWHEAIALFLCPVDEVHTRAWFRLAVPRAETDDAALAAFQHTIFGQDQPVLEGQRPQRLPLADGAERHGAADRLSTAYRRWLRAAGLRFGVLA